MTMTSKELKAIKADFIADYMDSVDAAFDMQDVRNRYPRMAPEVAVAQVEQGIAHEWDRLIWSAQANERHVRRQWKMATWEIFIALAVIGIIIFVF